MTTATLLAACNELLLQVGEIEVTALLSPPARKARLALQSSIRFVSQLHPWQHLQATLSPLSWVGGVATFAPLADVYQAFCNGYVISAAKAPSLLEKANVAPSVTGTPQYYAQWGDNSVLFYPTPSASDKLLTTIIALTTPTVPSLDTDSFTLPDEFYDAVMTYAQYLMHRNHTTDMQAAQQSLSDFELRIHMLRSRQAGHSVTFMGMLT